MGKTASAPPAPDYSGLINAANTQSNAYYGMMNDELNFAKTAYNDQKPYTDQIQKLDLSNAQKSSDLADSQRAQYQKIYQPMYQEFSDTAKNYASPDEMARARGQAQADVSTQFTTAGDAAKRNLESFGVDPSATRFGALDIGTRTSQAAATAAAGTQSDINRENTALGLQATALNIGNGLPGQITGGTNTSTAAGGAGVGAANSTYGTYSGALGNPQSFGGLSLNALNTAGGFTNNQYQNTNQQFTTGQNAASSGFGSAVGAGLGIASLFLKKGGAVPDPKDLMPMSPASRSSVPTGRSDFSLPRGLHKLSNVPLPMNFAGGGAIPIAGNSVPPQMSASGGAQTDDVPAVIGGGGPAPGGALPIAHINVGEFIMPKDVVNWLGQKSLQQQIIKARKDMAEAPAHPEEPGAPPQQGAPPAGGPHMAGGGAVPRPRGPTAAAPGFAGGAGRTGALPIGRPHMPAPYPGGSPAGAVRSAIPGI